MPTKLCAYGFSCASMMMQPGLTAEDCPNKETCGTIINLTEEEHFELYTARLVENQRQIVQISINRTYAAQMMLHERGCPQTPESLGLIDRLSILKQEIEDLEHAIEQLNTGYIAPESVEVCSYIVKRPYGSYRYNKLSSSEQIFEPQVKKRKVKVIHLSKNLDSRNIEAKIGIERRNRLLAIRTQIQVATETLNSIRHKVFEKSLDESVAEKITNQEI